MKRTIIADSRELTYVLTRKRVKNINLRIKSGGEIAVSAPRGMSGAQVDETVRKKAAWIFVALARSERAEGGQFLRDGGEIPVRGRNVILRVVRGLPEGVEQAGQDLRVTLAPGSSEGSVGGLVRMWLETEARVILPELLRQSWDIYRRVTGCEETIPPELTLRWMVSRWGSCAVTAYRITLNLALICLSPHSAAYVVFHELAHFQHPDHSSDFHALVARLLTAAGLPREAELRRNMKLNLWELVKG